MRPIDCTTIFVNFGDYPDRGSESLSLVAHLGIQSPRAGVSFEIGRFFEVESPERRQ